MRTTKNELWCIAPDGKITVVVKNYAGKLLNGPNDLWIRPDGGMYFSDPFYKRPYWNRGPSEQDVKRVLPLAGPEAAGPVIDDLQQPNGLIGTPDGKTLYVADIGAKKTYAYDIQPDGSLTDKQLFCELGSDGMTIDNEGNVYLTGKGVMVFETAAGRSSTSTSRNAGRPTSASAARTATPCSSPPAAACSVCECKSAEPAASKALHVIHS